MLFFEIEGPERLPSTQQLLESCGAKHGTALLSHRASGVLRRTRINCALQSHGLQTIKRLARTKRAAGFLCLQEILLGRKIGRLKKTKTGGAVCEARFGST
jgi:hypothetical protein